MPIVCRVNTILVFKKFTRIGGITTRYDQGRYDQGQMRCSICEIFFLLFSELQTFVLTVDQN
jgi:hypothetical protein